MKISKLAPFPWACQTREDGDHTHVEVVDANHNVICVIPGEDLEERKQKASFINRSAEQASRMFSNASKWLKEHPKGSDPMRPKGK